MCFFNGGVAVAAIDAVVGDVVLVTERNRLFFHHANIGGKVSPIERVGYSNQPADQEQRPKYTDSGDRVRTSMEDLHRKVVKTFYAKSDFVKVQKIFLKCGSERKAYAPKHKAETGAQASFRFVLL